MATLSATSTFAEIDAEIVSNLHYARRNSVGMAEALCTAIAWWRLKHPGSAGVAGVYTQFNTTYIDRLDSAAQTWLASYGTDNASTGAGGPIQFGFEEYRS